MLQSSSHFESLDVFLCHGNSNICGQQKYPFKLLHYLYHAELEESEVGMNYHNPSLLLEPQLEAHAKHLYIHTTYTHRRH